MKVRIGIPFAPGGNATLACQDGTRTAPAGSSKKCALVTLERDVRFLTHALSMARLFLPRSGNHQRPFGQRSFLRHKHATHLDPCRMLPHRLLKLSICSAPSCRPQGGAWRAGSAASPLDRVGPARRGLGMRSRRSLIAKRSAHRRLGSRYLGKAACLLRRQVPPPACIRRHPRL
jgi:hypothetical protein